MNSTVKQYYRYLFNSNKDLFLILFVLLGLVFPLAAIVKLNNTLDYKEFADLFLMVGCILAPVSTIYFFRHLFWKQSTDAYFAIPMKRAKLFKSIFWFSQLAYLVPLYIVYYITFIICMFDKNTTSNIAFYAFIMPFILSVLIVVVACICAWIVSFSNNVIDAITISTFYFILPFLLNQFLQKFIDNIFEMIFVGNGTFSIELAPLIMKDKVFNIWWYGDSLTGLTSYKTMNSQVEFWPLFFWAIVGIIAWYRAKQSYTKRKQEVSEQRTKKWFGYPLLSATCIFFFMLSTYATMQFSTTIMPTILLFFIFIGVMCVYQRKIHIRIRYVGIFLCMGLCCFGFTQVMIRTKGFHFVDELIQIEQTDNINLSFSNIDKLTYEDTIMKIVIGYDEEGNVIEKNVNHISLRLKDRNMMIESIELQKKTIELCKHYLEQNENDEYDADSSITFILEEDEQEESQKQQDILRYREYKLPNEQIKRIYGDFIYDVSAMQARGELHNVVYYEVKD